MVEKKKKTKKDLKKKVKKKLDKLKKKMPKKDFKKVAKKAMSKVDRTKGSVAIGNVLDRLRQSVPAAPQIIQDPRLAATQLKERLEKQTKQEFSKPIKEFKDMKKKYDEVLNKYKNGNLEPTDLFMLYSLTKQFATTANDYIPSQAEIGSAYRTVKSKLNYFKDWINRNRPSGQSRVQDIPARQQDQQPPPPPPPPSQEPPPPPQEPTPSPTPAPTLQNIYDSIPSVNLAQSTLAVGALATGGILNRLNNRINRNQRNIQNLERQQATDIVRNVAEQSLGQAVGNTIQQSISNINSNLDQAQNFLNELQNTNPATLNNRNVGFRHRNPLRQRTRETRFRQDIGEKFERLSDAEMQQRELEMELGGTAAPLTEEGIREELTGERMLDPNTDTFEEPTRQEVLDRLAEAREAELVSQLPEAPREDIQTRTEQSVMEDLIQN